jgi:hypothetical protein
MVCSVSTKIAKRERRVENSHRFSEVGENKQLLIAIVPVAQVTC